MRKYKLESLKKVCIIGAAGHSGYVIQALHTRQDFCITAVSSGAPGEDTTPVLAAVQEKAPDARQYNDYRQMLTTEKPDIVVVNTLFHLNAAITVACLQRNIPVYAEKPLALTHSGLQDIEKAWKKSHTVVTTMMGLRFEPAFWTAWSLVKSGAIGKVRLVTAQKSYRLGHRPEFYKHRETYGGTIPWVGSHAIDWVRWISGEEFISVSAMHSCLDNQDHGSLENSALCQFRMTGGVFASVNIDYLRPASAPSHGDDRIRIAGTTGVIEVQDKKTWLINGDTQGKAAVPLSSQGCSFGDFLDQIEGKPGVVPPKDAFAVTRACLLARDAADSGTTIRF